MDIADQPSILLYAEEGRVFGCEQPDVDVVELLAAVGPDSGGTTEFCVARPVRVVQRSMPHRPPSAPGDCSQNGAVARASTPTSAS